MLLLSLGLIFGSSNLHDEVLRYLQDGMPMITTGTMIIDDDNWKIPVNSALRFSFTPLGARLHFDPSSTLSSGAIYNRQYAIDPRASENSDIKDLLKNYYCVGGGAIRPLTQAEKGDETFDRLPIAQYLLTPDSCLFCDIVSRYVAQRRNQKLHNS